MTVQWQTHNIILSVMTTKILEGHLPLDRLDDVPASELWDPLFSNTPWNDVPDIDPDVCKLKNHIKLQKQSIFLFKALGKKRAQYI